MKRFNLFDTIRVKKPRRSSFNLSYDNKFSFNMGQLIPFYHTEVLPGDKFHINSEVFFRFAPMLAPILHEVDAYVHYFFVPNRLLWKNWEQFITGGEDGRTDITIATANLDSNDNQYLARTGSLLDYLGYSNSWGKEVTNTTRPLNRLPISAYQLIFNEYYRDQNIDDEVDILADQQNINSEVDGWNYFTLKNRRWRKDYFTSALPFAQRGGEVHVPIGAIKDPTIQFNYTGNGPVQFGSQDQAFTFMSSNSDDTTPFGSGTDVTNKQNVYGKALYAGSVTPDNILTHPSSYGITGKLKDTDLQSSLTINELRRTSALQAWLERNARSGARYVEQILAHFGVKSSDARLQRPEYLGGGKTIVNVSEVLQQSNSDSSDTPLGTMAGRAIAVGNTNKVHYFAEEHGYIMGILSVVPKATYFQGTHRSLLRQDKFDFYYPEFAHLGEQEIYNEELFDTGSTQSQGTFGYTPRYAEYKFRNDEVHGDFKDSLDFWHLGRKFSSAPSLNPTFLEVDEEKDGLYRVFAARTDTEGHVLPHIWCEIYNDVKASRLMPEFGTPMLM